MIKIKKLLMMIGIVSSAIFSLFFNNSSVKADEYYSGQQIWGGDYIPGVYMWKIRADGTVRYQQAQYMRRSEDYAFVYCLQPFADLDNSQEYKVARQDYELYLNLTKEQFRRASLYAYYGYGYGDHQEEKWYGIAQFMIWKTVDPTTEFFFSDGLGGNRNDSLFVSEMAELENLVNRHFVKPEFDDDTNIQIPITTTISLNDKNNKLSEFEVESQNNVLATINGNTLNITATEVGNGNVKLVKKDKIYSVPPIVYFSDISQDVFSLGSYDPLEIELNLDIIGGKVAIQKVDSKTLLNQASGQASLKGAVYGIYKEDGTKLAEIITDENGYAKSDYLPTIGKLYVQEISPSIGYKLDSTKYPVELSSGNLEPTIQVKENVVEGSIKISKLDSETNTCKAQGQGSLVGAKYQIIDINGNVVDTLTIGNDCTATSKKLAYGNYKVIEESSSQGYYIDVNSYDVFINAENTFNITSKENIIKGKIKITKLDSETNACKAQGQGSLVGAKYQITDINGNIVDTIVIGNDCTATSKELPFGNYKIKEISASSGYEIDTNVYDANIVNNNVVNVTSKEKIIKGKIKVTKLDFDNNSCKPSGQGSLVGAKYQIIDINGNVVDTLTIGNDCTAMSKDLPYGNYKIKEVNESTGYYVDTNIYDANVISNNIVNVTSKEQIIKGKIKITKLDSETNTCKAQGQGSLVGAKYQIIDINGNVVDTLTIGNDCTAMSKDLPYGKYKVREIETSKGYTIDTNIYDVNVISNNIVDVTSKEQIIKGKIKITKLDSETKACKSSGQGFLVGAKYQIINSKGEVIDTLVIGDDCTATSKYLPYDNYKIKELEASKGYTIDTTVYNTSIIELNKVINITLNEKIIKNNISILKQYEYVDGESKLLKAESNIKFEIYDNKNLKFKEIVTDEFGYARFELPYGKWRLHQVNTTVGYEKINDFYVTVDDKSNNMQYYNVLNNRLAAYLKVFKVDAETGKNIAIKNTAFKILNIDTNEYVSQFVLGKMTDVFYTDEQGIMFTNEKLHAGNYRLIEIDSPKGYLLNSVGLNFSIDNNSKYEYTEHGLVLTIEFKNKAIKGQIEVTKYGELFVINNGTYKYDKTTLKDVEFKIYANEEVLSSDGNYIYYHKGDLVDTIITNDFGYAISKALPLGKYYIIETNVNNEYILDDEKYYFELTEIDNKTAIVYDSYNKMNYLKKGKMEFTKTDLVNGEVIPNTIIEIYTDNGEFIFIGKTDNNGKIIIEDLKIGKYYIVERNPATGYVLNDEKVHFELKENGEIVKANMTNKPITGTLEFTKSDLSTDKPLPNTLIEIYNDKDELVFGGRTDVEGKITIEELKYGKYYILEKEAPEGYTLNNEKMYFEIKVDGEVIKSEMKDKLITGTLEFTKVDFSTDEPLPNTLIEIYNDKDELIFRGRTDVEGKITIEELKYGKYYILEKEAPEGYILNEEKMYFDILKDGQIIKTEMVNKKITSTIKIHKVDDNGNALKDVVIGIYDLEGNLLLSEITDEEGYIEVELEYGSYYFQEISTIEGYELSDEKVYFDVKEDGEIIQKTLVNELIEIEVPNTFSKSNFFILPISLMSLGIVLILISKKNKNKGGFYNE